MTQSNAPDFELVTEISGEEVTREQVERHAHRYYWAMAYCAGKDVLEVGCGNGQGLGYLAPRVRNLRAGDISPQLVARVKAHYQERVQVEVMDALNLPLPDDSVDVVLLFEAIYYLDPAEAFVAECRRVLRPGGTALIVTANKDLYDFNPSLYAKRYFGAVELTQLFEAQGFAVELFGYLPYDRVSLRQRVLRPVKKIAASLRLIPSTMAGKRWLKRIVFGAMTRMPAEIGENMLVYEPPRPVPKDVPDRRHKVLYCAASLPE